MSHLIALPLFSRIHVLMTRIPVLFLLLGFALLPYLALGCGSDAPSPSKSQATGTQATETHESDGPSTGDKPGPDPEPSQKVCTSDQECKEASHYCLADKEGVKKCTLVQTKNDGEPCTKNSECTGGTCFISEPWQGGYCTTADCKTKQDCASLGNGASNLCLHNPDETSYCVRVCTAPTDCRSGYQCKNLKASSTVKICLPTKPLPKPTEPAPELVPTCVDVAGKAEHLIEFTVPPSTTSYQLMVWLPNKGERFSLGGYWVNDTQLVPNLPQFTPLFRMINQSSLSAFLSLSPALSQHIKPGKATIKMNLFGATRICSLSQAKRAPGSILDLNLVLVGVPTKGNPQQALKPEEAADDPDIKNLVEGLRAIYKPHGITIRKVRFTTLSQTDVDRYKILRVDNGNYKELYNMFKSSSLPGFTYDDQMSLNIFLVHSLIGSFNATGFAAGVPGFSGVHGTESSGIVATAQNLRADFGSGTPNGATYTAKLIAHEVGHFLGLFHTTDRTGEHDPLGDTPECAAAVAGGESPGYCPDYENLMFWIGSFEANHKLTPQQIEVIRAHPLVKVQ